MIGYGQGRPGGVLHLVDNCIEQGNLKQRARCGVWLQPTFFGMVSFATACESFNAQPCSNCQAARPWAAAWPRP